MDWTREALAVFVREWRTEWRTRVALTSTVLFAVGALVLIGLAKQVGRTAFEPTVTATLLWIVLLFTAASGLGRAFLHEEERGTALTLRLCARGTTVWTGKFLANAVLLVGIAVITAPTLLTLAETPVRNVGLLTAVSLLGCIGIAAVLTTMSALVAQTSARGGLLAVVSFPLLTPLLLAGVHGTQAALGVGSKPGGMVSFSVGVGDVKILLSFAVIAITASLLLFDFLWND
ncbi:MAG: heme exporter protein CcmB [Capsulimonadales bacterium]|nr:heme exporter protein CcmB [Capsulimonadales bacterium]